MVLWKTLLAESLGGLTGQMPFLMWRQQWNICSFDSWSSLSIELGLAFNRDDDHPVDGPFLADIACPENSVLPEHLVQIPPLASPPLPRGHLRTVVTQVRLELS